MWRKSIPLLAEGLEYEVMKLSLASLCGSSFVAKSALFKNSQICVRVKTSFHTPHMEMIRDGGYSVTVSTRVCGTLSSGSNPDSHTRVQIPIGIPIGI